MWRVANGLDNADLNAPPTKKSKESAKPQTFNLSQPKNKTIKLDNNEMLQRASNRTLRS